MYVIEGQLALLLRLADAGGLQHRRSSAKALLDAGAIPYLTACRCVCEQLPMWCFAVGLMMLSMDVDTLSLWLLVQVT